MTINIPAIEVLAAAINNHAAALDRLAQSGVGVSTPLTVQTVSEGGTQATEAPAKETPAAKEKREIAEKIVELGGTPPEKGSLAKFRETLQELESGDINKNDVTPIVLATATDPDREQAKAVEVEVEAKVEEPETNTMTLEANREEMRNITQFLIKTEFDEPKDGLAKMKEYFADAGIANVSKGDAEGLARYEQKLSSVYGKTRKEFLIAIKKG